MFGQLAKLFGITLLITIIIGILSGTAADLFWNPDNWENLLRRTALFGILGIGVAFVIMAGGIDLSIGAIVCLAATLFAVFADVDYRESGNAEVYRINQQRREILLTERTDEFVAGNRIRLFGTRRAKGGLYEITKVGLGDDADGEKVTSLIIDGDPVSDDRSGRIARAFSLAEVTRNKEPAEADTDSGSKNSSDDLPISIRIAEHNDGQPFPSVRQRDRIVFLKQTTTERENAIGEMEVARDLKVRERVVSSGKPQKGGLIVEAVAPSEVDDSWSAILKVRHRRMPLIAALFAVAAICCLLGLLHGFLVTKVHLQPFVVTLCGFLIYRSFSRWMVDDRPQGFSEHRPELGFLADGEMQLFSWADGSSFGIPSPVFFLVLIAVVAIIFLRYTIWGRYILALGKNEEATRYCGIQTDRLTILTYLICAALAAVGGILFAMDGNSVTPTTFGSYFELYAIAAAVLGGCSLRGGQGSILGVIIGTFLMQLIYNATVLLGISQTLELAIIGLVILAAVISDELLRWLESRRRRT